MGRMQRTLALSTRPSDVGPPWAAVSRTLTSFAARYSLGASVRCWPGASAPAPGLCVVGERTILVDGELLGFGAGGTDGLPEPELRRRMAVTLGVTIHEVGHANHSTKEMAVAAREEGVVEQMKLLEEPRMERALSARVPLARKFIPAAVRSINAPGLPASGEPLSRSAAVHIGVVLGGRRHAGTLPAELVALVDELVEQGLGEDDSEALGDLLTDATAIADDDPEAMVEAARRLREIEGGEGESGAGAGGEAVLGALLEALAGAESAAARELAEAPAAGDGENSGGGEEGAPQPDSGAASASDGIGPGPEPDRSEHVDEEKAEGIGELDPEALRRLSEAAATVAEISRELAEEIRKRERTGTGRSGGFGFGAGGGFAAEPGGLPGPTELRAARGLARALQKTKARRLAREAAPLPGKLQSSRAVSQAAREARGAPGRSELFRRRREVRQRLWAPEVGVAIDTSGSMRRHERALGSVLWVFAEAVGRIGGRFCAVGFGDEAELICSSERKLTRIPEFSCKGGTERFDLAAPILRSRLRYTDRCRPRLLVVASDGIWTSAVADSEAELAAISKLGVATVHAGIGAPPGREHGADRVVSVADPEAFGALLGEECRRALEARPRARA